LKNRERAEIGVAAVIFAPVLHERRPPAPVSIGMKSPAAATRPQADFAEITPRTTKNPRHWIAAMQKTVPRRRKRAYLASTRQGRA
jgi:hypothetical protein